MRERMLTAHGEARSITEWARLKGLTKTILIRRLNRGWNPRASFCALTSMLRNSPVDRGTVSPDFSFPDFSSSSMAYLLLDKSQQVRQHPSSSGLSANMSLTCVKFSMVCGIFPFHFFSP